MMVLQIPGILELKKPEPDKQAAGVHTVNRGVSVSSLLFRYMFVAICIYRTGVADEFVKERTGFDLHVKIGMFAGRSRYQHILYGCQVTIQKKAVSNKKKVFRILAC
jgi:hypothetical protein